MDEVKIDYDVLGRLTSLNVLVALALATSLGRHPNPREAAFKLISSAEEGNAVSSEHLKSIVADVDLALLDDSARHNTMQVGKMVDAFLAHMGAPPRTPE